MDFISHNALSTLNIFELKCIEFLTSLSSGNPLFSANDWKSLIATVASKVSAVEILLSEFGIIYRVCQSLGSRLCRDYIVLVLCRARSHNQCCRPSRASLRTINPPSVIGDRLTLPALAFSRPLSGGGASN